VPVARFSSSARADLLSIGAFSLKTFGAAQAERYLSGLEQCSKMLAGNPALGRPCDWIRSGLYRFEKGMHVVFYPRMADDILILRILHQGMLPECQIFDDEQITLTPDL
jgi:toxin ParE1/3/4